MASNFNAGNAFPNRAPTKTLVENINSGYQTYANAYQATLSTYANNAVTASTFSQTLGDVPVLLFGQDYPVIIDPIASYESVVIPTADATTTVAIPLLQYHEAAQQQSNLLPATIWNPELLTPTLITYNRGQRVQGVSATNSVPVGGWAIDITIENLALQDAVPADIRPLLDLTCVFAGAVVDGPGIDYYGDGVGQTSSQPVILLETTYTQAMFDNNNIFTDGAGKNWEVMGLFIAQID